MSDERVGIPEDKSKSVCMSDVIPNKVEVTRDHIDKYVEKRVGKKEVKK